jgi:outer membrane protein TolC
MLYKQLKWLLPAGIIFFSSSVMAQSQVDTLVQLKEAIRLAQQRYHLLQARKFESEAATKNIEVAKYSRLPTIDASYQVGAATANNLIGVFYPNGLLPMTGPPSSSNNYNPATGSAASVLLNWQAITFGQRTAQINLAVSEANTQQSAFEQELFRHTVNVISSYLDVLLSYDLVRIHQHNIERVEANLKQSKVLAITGIKPGVDTALFLSELSKAKIDWLNAQKQLQVQQWLLAQNIVTDALPVPTDTSFLNQLPGLLDGKDTSFAEHPIIRYAQSQVQLSQSKELLLKKSWLPKLTVWGTAFARGSGFLADGSVKTWDGLGLSRYNYGAGLQLAFPIMKYGEIKRQLQQQRFLSKSTEQRLLQEKATLTTQQRIANTTFQNSVVVATETEKQLRAGQYAFNAIQIRYNTGLVNFADLIQAQYNLLKAELDVKQAHWDAWKALLLQAAVKGDVNVFLNEIK